MSKSLKKMMVALGFGMVVTFSAHASEIVVSAAASLTDAFKTVATDFEAQHPDIKVKFNFGGSGALLQQLINGAPVDVFASADQKTMDLAEEKNMIDKGSRKTFVENDLVIIVPADSKVKIDSLKALESKKVEKIALSNPDSVPVGRYSKGALEKAGLYNALKEKMIITQNVRQSLNYVSRGEVDCGFVYRTDAALMPQKVKVTAIVALDKPVSYPIAVVLNSKNAVAAKAFEDFVLSPKGQSILKKYGFSQVKHH